MINPSAAKHDLFVCICHKENQAFGANIRFQQQSWESAGLYLACIGADFDLEPAYYLEYRNNRVAWCWYCCNVSLFLMTSKKIAYLQSRRSRSHDRRDIIFKINHCTLEEFFALKAPDVKRCQIGPTLVLNVSWGFWMICEDVGEEDDMLSIAIEHETYGPDSGQPSPRE